MKPSTVTPSNLNGNGAGGSTASPPSQQLTNSSNVNGNGNGPVTYFRVGSAVSVAAQRNSGFGVGGRASTTVKSHQAQQNGNGSEVLFRRLQSNSNLVQIRRIITQHPQQFHEVAADLDLSGSSATSDENRASKKGTRSGGGVITRRRVSENAVICLGDGDESMGEVDVSVVDRGAIEDEDDEDLLVDHDDYDNDFNGDEKEGHHHRTALEMNGEGVDNEYLKHVIETQILNRHKAKIKDWDGTKGHMCQSCHESFLSENGLEAHRNRRIHHILFFCRYCKRDLSFFNKCRLLQHLRNHRVTPTVSGLQNCTMIRLLPESDYLHFKYEDCTSSSDDEDGKGSGSGGSGPPKRMKPNRFRRVARSSLSGNGLDSPDHSPPPNVTRQIVAPPQQLVPANGSVTSTPTSSQANSTISGSNVGTIKFAPCTSADKNVQQRSDQVTVIKSTGNTTSVILSSTANTGKQSNETMLKTSQQHGSSPVNPQDEDGGPQIRIRSLSQITAPMNDEGEPMEEERVERKNQLKIEPIQNKPLIKLVPAGQGQQQASSVMCQLPSSQKQVSQLKPQQRSLNVPKEYYCYKCERGYKSNLSFFRHLEEKEATGFISRSLHRCPTDDIPSWSQCQYVFHTKVFHEQLEPFLCPGCGYEAPDYNTLMEHVTNDCFYLCLRARYMCAAAAQKCSFADKKSVKTEPEIIDHLKKEHSRSVLQCLHCTQGFATENWLLKHLIDAHKISFDESKGEAEREALVSKTTRPLTQCLICNILFPNGPTYLQHVYLNFHMHILHAKMLECQSCFSVFETKEEILSHRKQTETCRRLDPFHMKITLSTNEVVTGNSGSQQAMTPTPIKIIANPAAIISGTMSKTTNNQSLQVKQQNNSSVNVSTQQGSTVVISNNPSNGTQSATVPTSSQRQELKPNQSSLPNNPNMNKTTQNSSQGIATVKSNVTTNRNIAKKSFFDDLQSCQFCERLVVFGSLRKHEDQCCGLSTIAPGFCLTCRQNFGDRKTLARHGVVHIREGLPICLYCNNRLIRPTHPKSSNPSTHENLYALKKHLYSNHTSKAVQFPFQCPLCNKICNDKRTTEYHIKDHQFKCTESSKDPDPTPLPTSTDDIRRLVKVRRKGLDPRKKANKVIHVYYCPVCKNREFALESGLSRHLKLVHQKNPKSLNLSLLRKASTARRFVLKSPEASSSSNLTNTIKTTNNSSSVSPQRQQLRSFTTSIDSRTRSGTAQNNTVLTRSSMNKVVGSSTATSSFTPRFSSGVVLRKRIVAAASVVSGRKLPQKPPPTTKLRSSSSLESSSKESQRPPPNFLQTRSTLPARSVRKKDGTFSCFRCPDFTCKTENAFCEHVKWKHIWSETEIQKLQYGNKAGLEEPSEFWCPECNTMFVAKPSLIRHLKFAHDYITNVEDYMQKIGYDGKKPLKPNQCEVCYFQCEDDRDLQQHMRTHGMAFLRLRQQRQLLNKS